VVNPGDEPTDVAIQLDGVTSVSSFAQATVLAGERNDTVNSFDQPAGVAPVTETVTGIGPRFQHSFAPRSLTLLRIGDGAPAGSATP
jgi:alpha-L-arabinofuranosidase